MKNSWSLANSVLAATLAVLMTQAGCDPASKTTGTGMPPVTTSSAPKTNDSSTEQTFTGEAAKGATGSMVAEKTESTEAAAGDGKVSMTPLPKSAPPAGYGFQAPVRIKAGDEYVSVESPGYACPTMADVDGDGLADLVVGQFNQGHMQFCKNIAEAGQPPMFAAPEWIKTGEERAMVPGVW